VLLGVVFRRRGEEHAATTELEAAHDTFERIGAKADAERAAELLGRQQARRTFLFTDIVGSTRLLETLGDEKWRKLLERHNVVLEEQIANSGGEVVQNTGDGFFATFATPRAALEAAVAIQRALEAEIVAPDVRIGAHTGDAFQNDGAANPYGGGAVHLAARIGAAAGAGEILASHETVEGAGTGFRTSEPRPQAFKGFAEPVDVISVEWK
jgi:class 3 adenylate cyclase